MMRRVLFSVVVLFALAAACGDSGETTTTDTTPPPSTSLPPVTTTIPVTGTVPATTAPTSTTPPTTTTTTSTSTPDTVPAEVRLALEPVGSGFEQPVLVTAPAGDPRLFVVDQPGRIWVVTGASVEVFLDIRDRVGFGGERGLLGLAFHPDDAARFFVHYSGLLGETRIEEFAVDAGMPVSAGLVLEVGQPAGNHNGGMIDFGPDGHLYIALGDGGASDDRFGNGQRPDTLLGTLLRIDVDGGDPYAIPTGNPFADGVGGAPEVWAYGLRNPWRFAFDAAEDLLYIADVGQRLWEEVNVVPAGAAGLNYGWSIMEGRHCFDPPQGCDQSGLVQPVIEYGHDDGCSVTGGFVYRGEAIPALTGHYFYGDYCSGWVASFRYVDGEVTGKRDWTGDLGTIPQLTSFGVDGFGELYVMSANGDVYRLVTN